MKNIMRFRWIAVKSDIQEWINWGMQINPLTEETNIDDQVIEYLMDREQFLNNITTSKEDIKTSPRSWEFVSDSYRAYKRSKENKATAMLFVEDDLLNTISGDIGLNVASDFMAFLEDNKNPLMRPEHIFEGESYQIKHLSKDDIKIIAGESILRKNVFVHNCLRYIKKEFFLENYTGNIFSSQYKIKEKLFIEIITKAINNNDLMYSIILDMKISKDTDDKIFLKHILDMKNVDILNAYTKLNQSF